MNKGMQRFGACCSFISMAQFFAGLFAAGFFPTLAPSLTPQQLTEIYGANQLGILFGGLIIIVAAGFCGSFVAAIFLQLRRMEGARPLGAFGQLASGIAIIQFFIFPGLLFVVAAYRPNRPAETLSALNDLAFIVTMLPWTVGAMQCLCIAMAVLSHGTRTTPYLRWVGFFNIWMAFGMASSSGCRSSRSGRSSGTGWSGSGSPLRCSGYGSW